MNQKISLEVAEMLDEAGKLANTFERNGLTDNPIELEHIILVMMGIKDAHLGLIEKIYEKTQIKSETVKAEIEAKLKQGYQDLYDKCDPVMNEVADIFRNLADSITKNKK